MTAPHARPERPLIIVRHGRTAANASGLLLGREDLPLDERGQLEAEAVGRAVSSGRFGQVAAVVSSPLLRARQTAGAIGLPVTLDDRFIELDYGSFEGTPVAEIPAPTWSQWRTDLEFAPPGGESIAALGVRVRAGCADWASWVSDSPGAVVIVSHVSPIKAAVAWALGVGDEVAWRTHLDTASVTRLGCRGGVPLLSLFNDTAHLHDLGAARR